MNISPDQPPLCLVEGYSRATQRTETCLFDYPHPASGHSWELPSLFTPNRRAIRSASPIRRDDASTYYGEDPREPHECRLCLDDTKPPLMGTFVKDGVTHHVHKFRNWNYQGAAPDPTPSA